MIFNKITLGKIFSVSFLFCPNRSEKSAEAPIPTIEPRAETIFIIGRVMPNPAIAIAPTPLPIKMLSVKLYSEVADIAMIAGSEKRNKSFQIESFASLSGVICFSKKDIMKKALYSSAFL